MNDIRPSYPPQQMHPDYEDEISLVDLWLTLARHKTIIIATAAICAFGGLAYGLISSIKHTYVTVIQPGSPSLESTKTIISKLEKLYIPTTQAALQSGVGVKVSTPDDQLIFLESSVPEEKAEAVRTLHSAVSKKLIDSHTILFDQQIASLKTLADNYASILRDLQNNNYAGVLGENISALKDKIARTRSDSDLHDRLELELKFNHSELAREQQQTKLASVDTQNKLDQLRLQIATAKNTSLVAVASETERKSKSPVVMVVLGFVLGGILGIFVAFLAEFRLKVKAAKTQA